MGAVLAGGALVLCAANDLVAADEKAAPSTVPSPSDDAISVARREFDAVKSARETPGVPKSGLPRMSVPELHPVAPPASPWTAPKTPASANKNKTENWLVDAMEKSPGSRPERERSLSDRERADRLSPKNGDEAIEKRDDAAREQTDERKPATAAANPLAQFLGTWMTPQDYALLKPGIEEAFDPRAAGSSGRVPEAPTSSFALPLLPGADGMFGSSAAPQRAAPPAPRENPYLANLTFVPAGPPPALPVVTSVPLRNTEIKTPPPLPPPVVPKSPIPDFAKPAADEKYFKQLKRF